MPHTLVLIDDDLLTREVLTLLASDAGYQVQAFDSGNAALDHLRKHPDAPPNVILSDLQMPGLSGDLLAVLLRKASSPQTRILAMSGSPAVPALIQHFEAFLLKPFDMDDLASVLSSAPQIPILSKAEILSESIHQSLARSLTPVQLQQLYTMSLDDADRRLSLMRQSAKARDDAAFRREAHAIKGGCGMVGALELAGLAGLMESTGLPPVNDSAPFQEFLDASARLRRILDAP